MTLLDTLKSLLGLERKESQTRDEDVGVTVEREADRAPEPVSSPAGRAEREAEPEAGGDQESEAADAGVEPETEEEGETVDEADAAEAEEEGEDETDGEAGDAGGSDEPTDTLKGIGPTYAERLSDAGVETVGDLAAADAEELADQVDNVGESRTSDWIDRAENR
jgi:predicted flap endonuclease-1-like 5' DNA nuclease